MSFNIGDEIKVIGLKPYQGNGSIGEITQDRGNDIYGVEIKPYGSFVLYEAKNLKVISNNSFNSLKNIQSLPQGSYIQSTSSQFKVGDTVRLKRDYSPQSGIKDYKKGLIGEVVRDGKRNMPYCFVRFDGITEEKDIWYKDLELIHTTVWVDESNFFSLASDTASNDSNSDYCTCASPQYKVACSSFSGLPTEENTYIYCTSCEKDKDPDKLTSQECVDRHYYIKRRGNVC